MVCNLVIGSRDLIHMFEQHVFVLFTVVVVFVVVISCTLIQVTSSNNHSASQIKEICRNQSASIVREAKAFCSQNFEPWLNGGFGKELFLPKEAVMLSIHF